MTLILIIVTLFGAICTLTVDNPLATSYGFLAFALAVYSYITELQMAVLRAEINAQAAKVAEITKEFGE